MDWEQLLQEGTNYIVQNAIKQTEKDTFWGSLGKFLGLAKDKNQKILVMGCAGVGKTRFITSLYNDAHAQLAHEERTKKSKEFAVKLQGLPITIADTAGHKKIREERADIFVKNMFEPTLTGIINVVSYGHHEIATLKQTVENNKISTDFRNTQLIQEVTYLQEWLPHLRLSNAKWVVTLVNKMDIWKPDWEEVRGYYENAQQPYQAEFERVFSEQRFEKPHFVFPYSSTMELSFGKLPIHISYAEHLGIQHRTQHELIDILNNH